MLNYLCYTVRQDVIDSLKRYVEHGIPTGGFLQAVLENNLREACARADEENSRTLVHIVGYIYNELPSRCWGSPEKVQEWLAWHRAKREQAV